MKVPAFFTAALAVLIVPAVALAQESEPYGWHHMWGGDGDWHGWFFGPLSMVLLLVAVVVVALLIGRRLGGPQPPAESARPTALDVLNERFARGEIDKEEFEERRRVLRG